ncbi:glycosyltransferase [Aestuariibacter halophilus]|uniref:Glycosyltransferase n=1 Tax=Fluctibacter halophilus TaxID=226011 RepID=A0ABS8GAM5_9ALTE|nr:MJ1255/VC2487 family glycosyltransferase [Aestuariibacter halophilus]MCC2617615.1 glycosyltransferase [Aestuariibacter halophilus]
MKILYGVQGTGNGHIARARVMAKALARRSELSVDFVFSGRQPQGYFDMDVFGQYEALRGLTFSTRKGRVSQWQTLKQANLVQLWRDIRQCDTTSYDVVLNDFEPITAWAAKRDNTPCISISHQASFAYPVPKQGDRFVDRLLTRFFAPGDIQLGVHWYHFGHTIMPPFIEEALDVQPDEKHCLVYLPFEEVPAITALLSSQPDTAFQCFHPHIRDDHTSGNIHWCKPSKPRFQHAIKHCSGVIANAGFELSSEALQLGKKLLLKPLAGQYEQLSNVLTLQQLDLCTSMQTLDLQTMQHWLQLPAPEPVTFPSNPDLFIDWLLNEEWEDTEQICKALWAQVNYPHSVKQRLLKLATS